MGEAIGSASTRTSMRPSAFANGNDHRPRILAKPQTTSMRPSAFANGNSIGSSSTLATQADFNEAVGFRQRKSKQEVA